MRGMGYWKLNNALLKDEQYKKQRGFGVSGAVKNIASHPFLNGGKWERSMSVTSPNYTPEKQPRS